MVPKNLRKSLNNKILTPGRTKWSIEVSIPNNLDLGPIYSMTTKCNMNAGIKYFDFQLLHTSLRINLHLFRISDSELCGKYNKIETITHLLYDCDQPKESMGKNHMWIHKYKKEKFKLNETSEDYIFLWNKHNIRATQIISLRIHQLTDNSLL